MWPEGLILENINNSDLERITFKPFCFFLFQSLVVISVQKLRAQAAQSYTVLFQHGCKAREKKAKKDLYWLQDTSTERNYT